MCHFDCSVIKRGWEESGWRPVCGWVTGPLGICQGLFCLLPWLPPLPSREGSGQRLRTCIGIQGMLPAASDGSGRHHLGTPSSTLLIAPDRAATLQGPLDPEPPGRTAEALLCCLKLRVLLVDLRRRAQPQSPPWLCSPAAQLPHSPRENSLQRQPSGSAPLPAVLWVPLRLSLWWVHSVQGQYGKYNNSVQHRHQPRGCRGRFKRLPAEPGITPLGAGTWGPPGVPVAGYRTVMANL